MRRQSNHDNAVLRPGVQSTHEVPHTSCLTINYLNSIRPLNYSITQFLEEDVPNPTRSTRRPPGQSNLTSQCDGLQWSFDNTAETLSILSNVILSTSRLKRGLPVLVIQVCPRLCHPLTSALCSQWRCSVLPIATTLHCDTEIRGS
jgi:hypothetical protein